jgi:hypothetical protein
MRAICQVVLAVAVYQPTHAYFAPAPGRLSENLSFLATRTSPRALARPITVKLRAQTVASTAGEDALDDQLVAERARLRRTSLTLWRWSSVSWWAQVILSVVSGVTLFFASAIEGQQSSAFSNGVFFSSAGLFVSVLSVTQTWRYARLASAIRQRRIDPIAVPARLTKSFNSCTAINLIGMAFALVSAEQVVGLLIARALSLQGLQSAVGSVAQYGIPLQAIRPLDVFVVQANTNTLASHFISLASTLWLKRRLLPQLP